MRFSMNNLMTIVILSNRKTRISFFASLHFFALKIQNIIQAELTKVCHTSTWTGCQQVAFLCRVWRTQFKGDIRAKLCPRLKLTFII